MLPRHLNDSRSCLKWRVRYIFSARGNVLSATQAHCHAAAHIFSEPAKTNESAIPPPNFLITRNTKKRPQNDAFGAFFGAARNSHYLDIFTYFGRFNEFSCWRSPPKIARKIRAAGVFCIGETNGNASLFLLSFFCIPIARSRGSGQRGMYTWRTREKPQFFEKPLKHWGNKMT